MSVDTTVMILKKQDQYYVGVIQAAENIIDHRDKEAIQYLIENARQYNRVTHELERAFEIAEECEQEHKKFFGYRSEYGVTVFDLDEGE